MALQRNIQQQMPAPGRRSSEWLRFSHRHYRGSVRSCFRTRWILRPASWYGFMNSRTGREPDGGVWLTDTAEFWEFEVMLSRANGAVLGVQEFKNASPSFPSVPGVPGTGAFLGYLALQVLCEARGA